MTLCCKKDDAVIVFYGNTYPHKELIKSLGARFNGQDKTWELPYSDPLWTKAQKLCASVPTGTTTTGGSPQHSHQHPGLHPELSTTAVYSIAELALSISQYVRQQYPHPIWVVGEVQNVSHHGNTLYFSLAQPQEALSPHGATTGNTTKGGYTVDAVVWGDRYDMIVSSHSAKLATNIFRLGMKVKVLATVTLYRARSKISLQVQDIDPHFTQGEIALQRQRVITKLKKLGVLDRNKSTTLPLFPFRIGLITASQSRAYSDFTHELNQHHLGIKLLFVPCTMQGPQTSKEVIAALQKLEHVGCDLIVLTRGGGSEADLHWFNCEHLALKITSLQVPLLAAIGHHDDECVAQDVAYHAEKTPTAASRYIISVFHALTDRIFDLHQSLSALALAIVEQYHRDLERSRQHLSHALSEKSHTFERTLAQFQHRLSYAANRSLSPHSQSLHECYNALKTSASHISQQHELHLVTLKARFTAAIQHFLTHIERQQLTCEKAFETHNPLPWIQAGWSQIFAHNTKISSITELQPQDPIRFFLRDGEALARIEALEPLASPLTSVLSPPRSQETSHDHKKP